MIFGNIFKILPIKEGEMVWGDNLLVDLPHESLGFMTPLITVNNCLILTFEECCLF